MLFGTLEKDMEYLWKKFKSPELDPSTGINQDEASEKLLAFADLDLPIPILKGKAFYFLAENLQIETDPRDFFPTFACWKRRPCSISKLLGIFSQRVREKLKNRPVWDLLNASAFSTIWMDFDHSVPEWDMIFSLGFPGLLENVRYWKEQHRKNGTLTKEKEIYFEGIEITYNGILLMLDRFIERAESKKEERCTFMAESLKRLRTGTAENFYDALQLIYLYFMFSEHMDHMQVRSLGNLDVMLKPFYEKALEEKLFTKEEMQELFDHFFMQWGSIDNYWGQPVYLGGTKEDGTTQISHMTYFILEEAKKLNLPSPKIQIKIAKNTPDDFLDYVLSMIRDQHQSIVLVGEEAIRHIMTSRGATEEDARTCRISGCYEFGRQGKTHSTGTAVGHINLLKPFELIFNKGIEKRIKQPIGVEIPPLEELKTFDDFYRLYLQELYWAIDANIDVGNEFELYLDQVNSGNVFSATIPSSLRKGKDAFGTGSDFNTSALLLSGFGSAIDNLAIVEYFVYKEKSLTLEELAAALNANWEGYEFLQKKLSSFPFRYGNNCPDTDRFATMLSRTLGNYINGRKNARGSYWSASGHNAKQFFEQGLRTGATPDGRFDGEEMSKNVSPVMGADVNGVTALLQSVLKADPASLPGDFPLDVMMHPSSVQGKEGLAAWRKLIRYYFAGNGAAIHFNIFDASELKKAQKEPEKYKNLQVRVCGWNVRFAAMDKKEQDMYIKRAENIKE